MRSNRDVEKKAVLLGLAIIAALFIWLGIADSLGINEKSAGVIAWLVIVGSFIYISEHGMRKRAEARAEALSEEISEAREKISEQKDRILILELQLKSCMSNADRAENVD